jgi:hypothetical protein
MLDIYPARSHHLLCFELARSSSLEAYLWGWLEMHWLGGEDVESLCTQEQVLQTLGPCRENTRACAHMLMFSNFPHRRLIFQMRVGKRSSDIYSFHFTHAMVSSNKLVPKGKGGVKCWWLMSEMGKRCRTLCFCLILA